MKKTFISVGLLIILCGSFINGLFVRYEIHGLIRELMRLMILSGIIIFFIGLVKSSGK